jgi:hypothetical protein
LSLRFGDKIRGQASVQPSAASLSHARQRMRSFIAYPTPAHRYCNRQGATHGVSENFNTLEALTYGAGPDTGIGTFGKFDFAGQLILGGICAWNEENVKMMSLRSVTVHTNTSTLQHSPSGSATKKPSAFYQNQRLIFYYCLQSLRHQSHTATGTPGLSTTAKTT